MDRYKFHVFLEVQFLTTGWLKNNLIIWLLVYPRCDLMFLNHINWQDRTYLQWAQTNSKVISLELIFCCICWAAKSNCFWPVLWKYIFQQVYKRLQTVLLVLNAPSFHIILFSIVLCLTFQSIRTFWRFCIIIR